MGILFPSSGVYVCHKKNAMKKQLLLLMLFAGSLLAFTGCKKDDDASIEGSWKLAKYESKYYENNELIDEESEDVSNSNWVVTLVISGNKWTAKETNGEQTYTSTGTYVLSGNKLTVNEDDDSEDDVYTVQTLTDNSLVLYSEDIEVEDGVTGKEVYVETYVRQ